MGTPDEVLGFRLLHPLGRGGQSVVYEARGPGGRRAAVKILSLERAEGLREAELFERGCRVLQALDHPFLPEVIGFEATAEGELRLVTELFAGGSLQDRVEGGWHARPAEIRALLAHLLGLLAFLHERTPPILHRDIKPSNLLFRRPADELPALVDFDVVASPDEDRSGLTIVGTPGYAAPEQFAGVASERSDLYAVGATVLYAATHVAPDRLPRRDGRPEVGARLDRLDAATRRVLLALLEPRDEDRPPSARAALAMLSGAPPTAAPPPRRAATRILLAAAVSLAVATGGAVAVLLASSEPTPATPSAVPAPAPPPAPRTEPPPPAPAAPAGADPAPRVVRAANPAADLAAATGTCDERGVSRVVRRHAGALRRCLEQALKASPDLAARLEVTWTLAADGRVADASIAGGGAAGADLEACILAQVRRWRFPPPEGGACTASVPLVLRAD